MPKEFEFMKSAQEKGMSDEEYKTLHDEYSNKANILSVRIKKLILVFLVVYLVSFLALYLYIAAKGIIDVMNPT